MSRKSKKPLTPPAPASGGEAHPSPPVHAAPIQASVSIAPHASESATRDA